MELKASDLRIGNYIDKGIIHWIGYDYGILVCGILENEYSSMASTVKLASIKPIPLTEQWLMDFGFSKKSAGDITYYAKNGFNLKFSEYVKEFIYFEFVEVGSGESDFDICDLYFVHQTQNLYYALQSKELTK